MATRPRRVSVLGWKPTTTFPELVRIMLAADILEAGLDPDAKLLAVGAA